MSTGSKPGAAAEPGRPRGRKDRKRSKARVVGQTSRKAREFLLTLDDCVPFEGSALYLLQIVYKNPNNPSGIRLEAARHALPYESPRLAAVNHSGNIGSLSHEEALAELRKGKRQAPAATVAAAVAGATEAGAE